MKEPGEHLMNRPPTSSEEMAARQWEFIADGNTPLTDEEMEDE